MGCNCGKRAGSTSIKSAGMTSYEVTLPSGEVKGPYLTPIEARREIRRAGGGTVRGISETPTT